MFLGDIALLHEATSLYEFGLRYLKAFCSLRFVFEVGSKCMSLWAFYLRPRITFSRILKNNSVILLRL